MISRTSVLTLSVLAGFATFPGCEDGSVSRPYASDPQGSDPQDRGKAAVATTTAPRLRLRLSGSLEGYLMPCGCATGLMGGLARRAFRNALDRHNIDLFLEGGRLIKKAGELELSKFMATLNVLVQHQNYHAIGLAAVDLTLDMEEAGGWIAFLAPAVASDLLLANGKPWQFEGQPVARPFREEKFKHVTARVASLVMKLPAGDAGKAFKLLKPEEAWNRAMQGVAKDTYRVLMVHAGGRTIKRLRFDPKPDLIVGINNDYAEPPSGTDDANGVPLVYPGVHGRVLLDVTLARGPSGPLVTRYQTVQIKEDLHKEKAVLAEINRHREEVAKDNLLEKLANRKPLQGGLEYVGAAVCADCHEEDAGKCEKHAHSHAWQTLIDAEKKEKWPVTKYPECVSCHVVGYGYKTGFVSPKKTPDLLNVTCENCHGPGSKHVEDDSTPMPFPKPAVKVCTECHNSEHSPKFDYNPYWKKILHGK